MADPAWTKQVLVLPHAIIAAADCPYIQLNRLSEALECLAVYAARRANSRGISAEQIAIEAGLGNVYSPHISFTAANKHWMERVCGSLEQSRLADARASDARGQLQRPQLHVGPLLLGRRQPARSHRPHRPARHQCPH